MDKWDVYPGLIVQMKAPRAGTELVKVVKTNPKKAKVVKENGEMWNVPYVFLHPAEPSEAATFSVAEPDEQVTLGSVVKFKDDLYVICGARAGAYRLAKLGGDGGRYYTGIYPASFEVVKFNVAGV